MILAMDAETMRNIGMSHAKVSYVKNVCFFFKENKITDATLAKMENETIIELLTQIKGVGRWTVEMILMFTLGREDVFAADDLVIQQGMIRMYGLDASNKKSLLAKMNSIAAQWKPYRSYACRYIWNLKNSG